MDLVSLINTYEAIKNSPVDLTDLEIQLAGLSYHLGEKLADAKANFDKTYNKVVASDKISVANAEHLTSEQTGNEIDRLKASLEAVDRLIWSVRDRVKVLTQEKRLDA